MILDHFPPMGVYETLFAFAAATKQYMGDPGTHPWAQGFPLTSQLPGGPALPSSVSFGPADLKYPTATGHAELRQAIADYYRRFYGAQIDADNVAVFAGGRPAILATLMFLQQDFGVAIEATEYTPYWDMLQILKRKVTLVRSDASNRFRPGAADWDVPHAPGTRRTFAIRSNPLNPTGVTLRGDALAQMVKAWSSGDRGALFDEAYEFFNEVGAESALKYVDDLDATNLFVIGAATKGLQVPGARVGWAIASKAHIELFRNFSSIAMGGVSRPSQLLVTQLFSAERIAHAREAVRTFYNDQRARYGEALARLGFELHSGDGGFYHWAKLPNGLTAAEFNRRLFEHQAAILPGPLCDMTRSGDQGVLGQFIRFSFGPLPAESFARDIEILTACVA